jgi:tetratricopeptide (TPR) repeat protein
MKTRIYIAVISFFFLTHHAYSQPAMDLPQSSQKAGAWQYLGLTKIKVSYSSPLVKDRKIWGGLVPYGQIWRAGANENTIVHFSTEVMVQGETLNAGSYGLHMIPEADEWTIIFSNNSTSWGSYFYKESEDALRVKVIPESAAHQEWLSYSFENIQPESADLVMRWEKLAVRIHVDVDLKTTVLESMRDELRGLEGFTWQGPYEAARFCMDNNYNHDEAMKWIDRSISREKNFSNLTVKAGLLRQQGQNADADKIEAEALAIAKENELNAHGYRLMNNGEIDKAIEVFRMNIKRHPDSWNVYDSLGEALASVDDKDGALKNYSKALKLAPDNQKERIEAVMKELK